jgi:hypothetical protein
VCGADPSGTVLPWWAVPAIGGEVIVRSVRERSAVIDHTVLVVVRAAIERVVPLDLIESAERTRDRVPPPLRGLGQPKGPRRSNRPPTPTMG